MKKLLGLTGGIASGKSTVGKIFKELGVTVIDADQLARDVVMPNSPGLQEVLDSFGSEYQTPEGALDRAKLGQHIFAHPEARAELDSLLHPRIHELFKACCTAAHASNTPYILYEAALLVELKYHESMDRLIVVAAARDLQIRRVMKRNGISEEEATARVDSQYPLERKLEVANYVIFNDNDRAGLRIRTLDVHEQIMAYIGGGGGGGSPAGF